jgi:hypothetical protein
MSRAELGAQIVFWLPPGISDECCTAITRRIHAGEWHEAIDLVIRDCVGPRSRANALRDLARYAQAHSSEDLFIPMVGKLDDIARALVAEDTVAVRDLLFLCPRELLTQEADALYEWTIQQMSFFHTLRLLDRGLAPSEQLLESCTRDWAITPERKAFLDRCAPYWSALHLSQRLEASRSSEADRVNRDIGL